MTLTYSYRGVLIRAALLTISGTLVVYGASAQSSDRALADRDALKQQLQQMDVSPARTDEAISRRVEFFREADLDGDGMLTEAELKESLEYRFSRADRNDDGFVSIDDAPRFGGRDRFISRVSPLIEERDGDGDGALSFEEFSQQILSGFANLDDDGDGQLDLDVVAETINEHRFANDA